MLFDRYAGIISNICLIAFNKKINTSENQASKLLLDSWTICNLPFIPRLRCYKLISKKMNAKSICLKRWFLSKQKIKSSVGFKFPSSTFTISVILTIKQIFHMKKKHCFSNQPSLKVSIFSNNLQGSNIVRADN